MDTNKTMTSALIVQRLCRHGWRPANGAALAMKSFETAVGLRNAFVYLADHGRDSSSYSLQGDYQSEGRNRLGPCFVMLPKDASAAGIQKIATEFAVQAETAIEDTYAMRLAKL